MPDVGISGPGGPGDYGGSGFGGGGNDAGIGSSGSSGSGESSGISANDAGIISGLMEAGVPASTLAALSGPSSYGGFSDLSASDAGILSNLMETAVLDPDKLLSLPLRAIFGTWDKIMSYGLSNVLGKAALSALSPATLPGLLGTLAGSTVLGNMLSSKVANTGKQRAAQQNVVNALGFNPFGNFSSGFSMMDTSEPSDGASQETSAASALIDMILGSGNEKNIWSY